MLRHISLMLLASPVVFAGPPAFKEISIESAPPRRAFEVSLESAQMFNYDDNPNRYFMMTQMLSFAWEPFQPLRLGPVRVRTQILSTIFASAIFNGPETVYLGWGPQARLIFPFGDSPWSIYLSGGIGIGYANADVHAKEDWGLGQELTFIVLGGGGFRCEVSESWAIWTGILWHHMSNGDLSEPRKRNTGVDQLGVVAGAGWAF